MSNRKLVPRTRLRLWPRSLASRMSVTLMIGLILVQAFGLTLYTMERFDLQLLAEAEELGSRIVSLYRSVVMAPPQDRQAALSELDPQSGLHATLDPTPATSDLPLAAQPLQQAIRISMQSSFVPQGLRWTQIMVRGSPQERRLLISMRLPTEEWLNVPIAMPYMFPFFTTNFLVPFLLMAVASTALVAWAAREFSEPMRELAAAAERLGTDVNMPPMAEMGPTEVAKAARAFNTMAERIRRFVRDRTFLLTAIGHDLRTPITRLKLRAEWMEDEEQRDKMLTDLDELEGMVAATLAFGRDDAATESMRALDLAELLRTILDEASDARSNGSDITFYEGPDHQVVRARPVSIKRALSNLVANALNYGGSARVCLMPPRDGMLTLLVEDAGPGIPPGELERVFEPFHRLEPSRNRETGGTGLGLPIARNILRAHGGDVTLANRPSGGVRASVTLPA